MAAAACSCTSCGQAFRVLSDQAGHAVRCPHCRATNHISLELFQPPPETQPPAGQSDPEPLTSLANTVATASTHGPASDALRHLAGSARFAHSRLGRRLHIVAMLLLGLSCVVLVGSLLLTDWEMITSLPIRLALPALAALFLPVGTLAVVGLFVLAAAESLELLARIAARISHPGAEHVHK